MSKSPLDKVRTLTFPKICDPRGNLSFIEGGMHVPFSIKRIFYIYDVPGGESRGAHAHYEDEEVLIAVAGSLEVHLSDGREHRTVHLNRSNMGLYIPPHVWASMHEFTTGTVCLALSSTIYEEADYMRDYEQYVEFMERNVFCQKEE